MAAAFSGVPLLGGYEYDFVCTVPEKWICLVCQLPMKDPVQVVGCGHRLCQMCADEVMRHQPSACPADRAPISPAQLFPDVGCKREIEDLHILCPNNCCEWTGEIRAVGEHCDKKCLYEEVPCENDRCEDKMKRKDLAEHTASKCQWRIIKCRFCMAEFPSILDYEHFSEECKRFPVSCGNKCGVRDIPREEMETHLAECPLAVIECEFKMMGCNEEFQRQGKGMHTDFTVKYHLELVCKKLKGVCEELTEQKQKELEREKVFVAQEARIAEREARLLDEQNRLAEQGATIAEQQTQIDEQERKIDEQGMQIEEKGMQIDEQGTKINEQEMKLNEQETKLNEQEAKINEQETKINEQEAKINEQEAKINEQEAKINEQETTIYEQVQQIAELQIAQAEFGREMRAIKFMFRQLADKSNGGESDDSFLWTISNIADNLNLEEKVTSDPFYLHGYRLKLSIVVKDSSRRASATLGMTFSATKGKFDDDLEWPFSGSLQLTVANFKGRGGCTTSMTTKLNFEALSRPSEEEDSHSNVYANIFLPRFVGGDKILVIKCEMI